MHLTYHFPHMEEALQLLKASFISQQQLLVASQEPSSIEPLVDQVVNSILSSVNTTPPLKGAFDTT